jgi:DNA-binding TFAR19-related protein (PDSD5 family)
LLKAAQTGQLRGKVTEKQLQDMLEKLSENRQETTVTFKRSSLDDDW